MAQYTLKWNPGPVTAAMQLDTQSKVKLVNGPLGSGKTSAGVWQVMDFWPDIVKPIYDEKADKPLRKSRHLVVRECYDDKTEILTENGWKLFKDLESTEAVAILKDGKTAYEVPSYYYSAPYKGDMITIKSDSLDLCVTPDHKLYVQKKYGRSQKWPEPAFVAAADAYGNESYRFLTTAEYDGREAPFNDDFMEFLGFWFAEGIADVYDGRFNLTVTQCVRTDYADDVCGRSGLTYSKNKRSGGGWNYRFKVTDEVRELVLKLKSCGKALDKRIPKWISNCSAGQARAFLTGFIMGDGSFRKTERETTRAWTSSGGLADDLQIMALKAGWMAIKRRKKTVRNGNPEYVLTFLQPGRTSPRVKKRNWGRTTYDGTVYCVTVSTHVVYVRRNGKAVWCSQTYPQLEKTTMETFFKWFPKGMGTFNVVRHEFSCRMEDRETTVIFMALDKASAVEDVKSLDLTCAWIDESQAVREDVAMHIRGRLGRFPSMKDLSPDEKSDLFLSPYQLLMTTNPPPMSHWTYRDFVSERKPGFAFYKCGQDENRHNLPATYYQDLAEQYSNRPDLLRTLVMGDWGITVNGEAVYPEFRRDLHVSREPIPLNDSLVIRGWDNTGLHPACIITQFSSTGQWCLLREFLAEDTGIEEFAETVLTWCRSKFGSSQKYRDVCDPAGRTRDAQKMSPAAYMRRMGINVEDGIQTPKIRIEAVKSRLAKLMNRGQPAMLIDPSCSITIEGFEGAYAYKEKANGVFDTKPLKNKWSDIHDSIQYVATRLFITRHADPAAALRALEPKLGSGWMAG